MAKKTYSTNLKDMLAQPGQRIPNSALRQLSDIEPAALGAMLPAFRALETSQRRELLTRVADMFEQDTRLSFTDFGRAVLGDPDDLVRANAVRLLAESEQPGDATTLVDILENDPALEPRLQAAEALGGFVELGQLEALPSRTVQTVEAGLLRVLGGDSPVELQRAALESLGYSSRPEVTELIDRYLSHSDPRWVASALTAAERSVDDRWNDQVLDLITSPLDQVRLAAVEAAGELVIAEARLPLIRLLDGEEDPDILMSAIWSLSQIGGEDVEVTLEALLDATEDDDLAAFIEEALENLAFANDAEDFSILAVDPDDEPGEDD